MTSDPMQMETWQEVVYDEMVKAHAEGRTQLRYVQGRRGASWVWVKPTTGGTR